jgi:DNA-binding NarL/FixJ family response regulator
MGEAVLLPASDVAAVHLGAVTSRRLVAIAIEASVTARGGRVTVFPPNFMLNERRTSSALHGPELDLVLVDLPHQPSLGLSYVRRIAEIWSGIPIVAMLACLMDYRPQHLAELQFAGARALIDFSLDGIDLWECVVRVLANQSMIGLTSDSGDLLAILGGRQLSGDGAPLTARDLSILRLVAQGSTDRKIGAITFMSPHTVKHHIEKLRVRVGVENRTELAAWAATNGLYENRNNRDNH